jgi:L-ascorbate metabolism protein UlaG (beta-lactamase superfamily)
MEITWYGQTCFRLSERGLATVLTDPYPPEVGLTLPRPRADIVTISRDDPYCTHTAGVRGPFRLVNGPGEYEIGGVFVTGLSSFADGKQGSVRGRNTIFTFNYGGLALCHLGYLGHVPTQSQLEATGAVDVLLVPVGGGGSLSPAQAAEVISLFEAGIVIPMHYKVPGLTLNLGTLARFLKEMGLEQAARQDTLKLSRSDVSEETRVIVLECKQRDGG